MLVCLPVCWLMGEIDSNLPVLCALSIQPTCSYQQRSTVPSMNVLAVL